MKSYKKALVASLATIGVSSALIGGATLALFTSDSTTNIAVTSGKVSVVAEIDANSLTTYSYEVLGDEDSIATTNGTFVNGGTATIEANKLTIENITPGDKVEFEITITNYSTVTVQYMTSVAYVGEKSFYNELNFKMSNKTTGKNLTNEWKQLEAGKNPDTVKVSLELPLDAGNEYQDNSIALYFNVKATQGNAQVEKPSFSLPEDGSPADNGQALVEALSKAKKGANIIVPYAEYELSDALVIEADGVTLKGETDIYGEYPVFTLKSNENVISGTDVTVEYIDFVAEGTITLQGENITFNEVEITATEGVSALTVADEKEVTLNILGNCAVTGGVGGSGIYGSASSSLTIKGDGESTLVAIGNNNEEDADKYANASTGSGIYAGTLVIDGLKSLTALGCGTNGYGVGAESKLEISDTTIEYARGGNALNEPKASDSGYVKDGGGKPAIGVSSGEVTLKKVTVNKAEGGLKAAGIGSAYWGAVVVNIEDCTLSNIVGGASAAAIGGGRANNTSAHRVEIYISGSTITDVLGGYYGAGIGSGYDTNCGSDDKDNPGEQYRPTVHIEIKESELTNIKGGKYAAGIGTGFHVGVLTGSIDSETAEKMSGIQCGDENVYRNTYTTAQDIGYGVADPKREFYTEEVEVTFTVAGKVIDDPRDLL